MLGELSGACARAAVASRRIRIRTRWSVLEAAGKHSPMALSSRRNLLFAALMVSPVGGEVFPCWVGEFDQLDLAGAGPGVEILFAGNRVEDVLECSE